MPKSEFDTRLQSRIDDFVHEINALVREAAVEAVHEALSKGGAPRGSARGGKASPRSGKRIRRTGAQVDALAARALASIRRQPGRRLGEIAGELNEVTKDVRRPVQTLLDDKKVRTTGQRGGTRYFPAASGSRKAGRKKPTKKKRKAKRKGK